MKKARKTEVTEQNNMIPDGFVPTQEQIDALARRLMPEIKRFFADSQIQQEFTEWLEKQQTDK